MARRHVFLSPHPDDAVWSCGGLLLALVGRGEPVLVVTIFDDETEPSGEPWRRTASSPVRRKENARALARVGAAGVSLGLTDAALRQAGGSLVYDDVASLWGPEAAVDAPLCGAIRERLESLLDDEDQLYAPAAGAHSHVDHRIARAATAAMRRPQTDYQDFPYAEDGPNFFVDPELLPRWIEASCLYGSQAIALFGSRDRFRVALRGWATRDRAALTAGAWPRPRSAPRETGRESPSATRGNRASV